MGTTDKIVEAVTAFLVRSLLCPKVFYLDKERQTDVLSEPSIVVCNHTSHLDGPVVNTVFRRSRIHSLAAKDRFGQKFFGFFLRHTGCIPIDRQNADTSWVHESLKVLRVDRENIAIYPEGRHGGHRQMLPFHPGVTMLTGLAQVPVVLVYIDGPHRLFRRSKLIIAPPFRLEPPIDGMTADYFEKQTGILQDRMKDLMEEFISIDGQAES